MNEVLSYDSGIHSTVPIKYNPQGGLSFVYDERREKILLYLLSRKPEIRTAYKIAVACGLPAGQTQPLVRKLIKELNHIFCEKGLCCAIVSTPSGYFYTENPQDIIDDVHRHYKRLAGLRRAIGEEISILQRFNVTYVPEYSEVVNDEM